jgi:hypothetical protein
MVRTRFRDCQAGAKRTTPQRRTSVPLSGVNRHPTLIVGNKEPLAWPAKLCSSQAQTGGFWTPRKDSTLVPESVYSPSVVVSLGGLYAQVPSSSSGSGVVGRNRSNGWRRHGASCRSERAHSQWQRTGSTDPAAQRQRASSAHPAAQRQRTGSPDTAAGELNLGTKA